MALPESAVQFMAILKYFATFRRSATHGEIARALSYPRAATGRLLVALAQEGVLTFDPTTHRYQLSARVGLLVARTHESLDRWIGAARGLHADTGLTVAIFERNGAEVEAIEVLAHGERTQVSSGERFLIIDHPAGIALLSLLTNLRALKLIRHANESQQNPTMRVREDSLLEALRIARARGFVIAGDRTHEPTTITIAAPMTSSVSDARLAVVVYADPGTWRATQENIFRALANYVPLARPARGERTA